MLGQDPREPSRTADEITVRLLGSPRTMRRREVSAGAQLSLRSTRRFWHALGFPNVREEDTVFTDADLGALRAIVQMVREGAFTEEEALAMTRALGRTADRLAVWQTQLMAEALQDSAAEGDFESGSGSGSGSGSEDGADGEPGGEPEAPDPALAREAAVRLADMADTLEPLLVYAWRRHLGGAISRLIADAEPVEDYHGVVRTVGFADLVSFTELVRRTSERGLSRLVQRFEALSSDVIASEGGRVIKTVGDEVLYQCKDPATAVRIAVELVRAIEADELLPDVRVGMATGRVLLRLGDIYGTTVNRAARLTAQARAGTVLVDEELAEVLHALEPETPEGLITRLAPRLLEGLGEVTSYELDLTAHLTCGGPGAGANSPPDPPPGHPPQPPPEHPPQPPPERRQERHE